LLINSTFILFTAEHQEVQQ